MESTPGSQVDSVSDQDKVRKLSKDKGRHVETSCSLSPKLKSRFQMITVTQVTQVTSKQKAHKIKLIWNKQNQVVD